MNYRSENFWHTETKALVGKGRGRVVAAYLQHEQHRVTARKIKKLFARHGEIQPTVSKQEG